MKETRTIVDAANPHLGMTVPELRAAVDGVPDGARVEVTVTWRGYIKRMIIVSRSED